MRRAPTGRRSPVSSGWSTRWTARSTTSTNSATGRSAWPSRTTPAPLVGVVHDPVAGRTFTAIRGGGARLDGRVLRVNDPVPMQRALVGTGFGYLPERRATQGALIARLLPRIRDIRRYGSAALDLCAVGGRLPRRLLRGGRPAVGRRRRRPGRPRSGRGHDAVHADRACRPAGWSPDRRCTPSWSWP